MLTADFSKHILRFNFPAGTSRGVLHEKDSWIIKLQNSEFPHITGVGECSLIKGLSPDPEAEYEKMLEKVCANPEYYLDFSDSELDRFPSIRFGLEMARLDLQNGGTGVFFPSAFTQGEAGIPINGLIWMGSKENMLEQIKQKIKEGFTCIKLKVGALDFEAELNLLKAARREFKASDIELRVDANGAFRPGETLEKLKRLSEFQLHSIEQPVKLGNWEIMAMLCELSPLAIALDEELFAPGADEDKLNLLRTIRPQYLVLKPSMLGGFAKTQEWIDAANNMSIGWWITSALESNIGLNALAQWTYTLKQPVYHGLGTGRLFLNNFESRLVFEAGVLKYR